MLHRYGLIFSSITIIQCLIFKSQKCIKYYGKFYNIGNAFFRNVLSFSYKKRCLFFARSTVSNKLEKAMNNEELIATRLKQLLYFDLF